MNVTEEMIRERLAEMEKERGVRVLFACESGSRAWGFASPNSDYDVRFLYAGPPASYLRVRPERDVIEVPINADLDISGWDLRKALGLLAKSNPPLLEWLDSPIIYRQDERFAAGFREVARRWFDPLACHHHYGNMARSAAKLLLEPGPVRLKRYFYALRPVLACRWLERGDLGPVPMRMETMLHRLVDDRAVLDAVERLLTLKRSTPELGEGPPIPEIAEYLAAEVRRLEAVRIDLPPHRLPMSELDAFFRETLVRCFGPHLADDRSG